MDPEYDKGDMEAFPRTEDDGGPACGDPDAETDFHLTYTDAGGMLRFAEQTSCCHRHMPRPGDVLTEGAVPIEVVIQDASTKIVVRDGRTSITLLDGLCEVELSGIATTLIPLAALP